MASEFLLTFAMNQVLDKVGSLAADRVVRACGLKAELKRLAESATRIGAVLQDAEDKQAIDGRVRPWLLRLHDIVYAAEDVLEEVAYEALRWKIQNGKQLKGKVRDFFSCSNPILFRLSMAHKVKNLIESMGDMHKQATDELALRSVTNSDGKTPQSLLLDRETDSRINVSLVPIGREKDVSIIFDMLVASSSSQRLLTVVSVVGMAGLGKTTLAQLVFKQAKEQKLFDKTIWYCVYEDFDYRKILAGMLHAVDAQADVVGALNFVDSTLNHLEKELQEKNFLLVLDDVWNEEFYKWDGLKARLEKICNKSGNVVLVTSRSKRVASTMETSPSHMHELKGLSDDECWSIIKQKVCENSQESLCHEMETTGMAIAKKCGGVPLAAKVVGGILSSEVADNWRSIKESKVWGVVGQSEGIMPILRLSFDRLPSPLKQCFAYCSLFPKDFEFKKEQLIEMWMAEGFLETSMDRERREVLMEERGDECFNHLLANSFFQDVKRDIYGNICGFKMHELIHDLALSISKLETCALDDSLEPINETANIRRLSLGCGDERVLSIQRVPEFLRDRARKLRSFFSSVDVFLIPPNFKSLRTLDLSGAYLKELPASIGKLKHLRYIDISRNYHIENLPRSITKLYNLQTLRLIRCFRLKKFPRDMRKLVSLRHVYFDDKKRLITPARVGRLTNLQTLPLFVVGPKRGYGIQELEGLKELRGKLKIVGLEHVRDGEEARRAKLDKKAKLSKLYLVWSYKRDSFSSSPSYNDQVLEGLQPPLSVHKLKIQGYMGKKISGSSWMPIKLVKLKLKDCKRCEVIPTLGNLAHLKVLEIEGMTNVKSIDIGFYGNKSSSNGSTPFPALKEFILRRMENLVEWMEPVVSGENETFAFPCLEILEVDGCPCLLSIPIITHLSSLQKLEISECTNLESLPSAKGILSLKNLEIVRCDKLTSLPSELHLCTSLTRLSVSSCKELTYVADKLRGFTSLQALEIVSCPKLTSLPKGLLLCTSLETLSINSCDELAYLTEGFNQLDYFNNGGLTSLRKLEIEDCPKVTRVDGLHLCKTLEHLEICRCSNVACISGIQHLTRLKKLSIGRFSEELEEFPGLYSIHQLSGSLEELNIYGWGRLESLPPQLQHLTSLTKLCIRDFEGVEALPEWLCKLSSLQTLVLQGCKNLKSLLTVTAMRRLSKLEYLLIKDCPILKERCAKGSGREWSKISHIPRISIDNRLIKY